MATSQADECHCREAAVSLCCKDKTSHYSGFYFGITKVNKHFSATMGASRVSIKHYFAEMVDGSPKTHFFIIIIVASEMVPSPDRIKQD